MPTIVCHKNRGYKWFSTENCYFKGYLQRQDNTVFRGYDAIELLGNSKNYEEFLLLLKRYTGFFSIIVKRKNEIWLATDIARSMPLYYTKDLSLITDDPEAFQSENGRDLALDNIRTLEMYATSYVAFQNTIFHDIKQLELGCAAKIKNATITLSTYYVHHAEVNDISEINAIKKLEQLTSDMIKRILAVTGKRQIVISLSGGYDSRYLACSLKKNGIDNVICYTYGRNDSFEVAQAKKVASALGYKWFNISYDDKTIRNILDNEKEYLDYSNRSDYSVYLQNYVAVKALHDKRLVADDAVFMTGLCNDMPTGFYIPEKEIIKEKFAFTKEGLAEYNIAERFVRFNISDEAKNIFKKDILDYLERMGVKVNDYQSFVSALDCLETSLDHSHCFLNMNTVHEFFGYEWLLPCWDRALLSFWYSLPASLRIKQSLYATYITQYLAKAYGVGTKKYLNQLASKPWKAKLKRKVGGVLVTLLYPFGIPIRRNTDINNFSVLEVEIYKKIKQKKAVKAERAALILLLTIFMMEYRYGHNWYSDIKIFIA